ncbi:MAG: DNA-processing protein DprA [Phycisphaerales bacterium JB043]
MDTKPNNPEPNQTTLDLLRLSLTSGLGPTLTRRAIETLGSPGAVLGASPQQLAMVPRIGLESARRIWQAMRETDEALARELDAISTHDVSLVTLSDEAYSELLGTIPDPPMVLRIRGNLDNALDRYALAIVGSRSCSLTAQEQTTRFASYLASAGLTIVSGGARGIDTCAHKAALQAGGRTIVVMGCGLSHCYPPENKELFEAIIESGGCLISELPMRSAPARENFPSRNRIISGLALGVLVAEAGHKSGALITARQAVEEQGREVMAIPGSVADARCAGSNQLLRDGGATMVLEPRDVLSLLESPARHLHGGTHATRFTPPPASQPTDIGSSPQIRVQTSSVPTDLSESQRRLLEVLDVPRDLDEVARVTGIESHVLRADATMLELRRVVVRQGDKLARV